MASSFRKKGSAPAHPRGTRPSVYTAQPLVSTGVPSLDALLGGGLMLGTVLLVEEDVCNSYSRLLLKYFLSEGVVSGHSLYVASASENPQDIIKDLPGCVEENVQPQSQLDSIQEDSLTEGEEMKIAWRYKSKPKVQSSFSSQFGHFFDLTSHMESSKLEACSKTYFNVLDIDAWSSTELYSALDKSIQSSINEGKFMKTAKADVSCSVLRVCVESIGSPLWLDEGATPSLPLFLHSLRAALRQANAVAMITIPTHLIQDIAHVSRLERLSDAAIHLESFAGSDKEQNPLYRDYHGLFHLKKLPRLHSLVCHYPPTLDLAFKLKKKKFIIEKLHLPPELSDTANRAQEDQSKNTPASNKPSTLSKKIDF